MSETLDIKFEDENTLESKHKLEKMKKLQVGDIVSVSDSGIMEYEAVVIREISDEGDILLLFNPNDAEYLADLGYQGEGIEEVNIFAYCYSPTIIDKLDLSTAEKEKKGASIERGRLEYLSNLKEKSDIIEQSDTSLKSVIQDRIDYSFGVFKAESKPTVERQDGETVVNMTVECSADILTEHMKRLMPEEDITKFIESCGKDSTHNGDLVNCVIDNKSDFVLTYKYHKDMFHNLIDYAKQMHDPTIADGITIELENLKTGKTYKVQPVNQQWFIEFFNEELPHFEMQSAREEIIDFDKQIRIAERD